MLEAGFVEGVADGIGGDDGDGFSFVVRKGDEAEGVVGFVDGGHGGKFGGWVQVFGVDGWVFGMGRARLDFWVGSFVNWLVVRGLCLGNFFDGIFGVGLA